MTSRTELSGKIFGRLTVVKYLNNRKWLCLCSCGRYAEVRGCALKADRSKSCGCLSAEMTAARQRKHGHARGSNAVTPEYRAWADAKARCLNPKTKNWHRYGGRGIRMSEEWIGDFKSFLSHIGPRPSAGHSLDRHPNNDGNYEPGNVRWATSGQQRRNQSSSRPDVSLGS